MAINKLSVTVISRSTYDLGLGLVPISKKMNRGARGSASCRAAAERDVDAL